MEPNVKPKTRKLVENIGENHYELWKDNSFLDLKKIHKRTKY